MVISGMCGHYKRVSDAGERKAFAVERTANRDFAINTLGVRNA